MTAVARRNLVQALLAAVGVAGFAALLISGSTFLSLGDVIRGLGGAGSGAVTMLELRLPRAILAVLTGLAFGLAGAVCQSLLRNTLASPDIIGISAGASAAAVFGIVVLGAGGVAVSMFALFGAFATAALIALLSAGAGNATLRMILIGVGAAAMLNSLVTMMLSRASSWDLQGAMQWLAGSLNGASWDAVMPLAVCCAIAVPAVLMCERSFAILRLGDELATGLGMRATRTRWMLMGLSVVLLAVATSAAGPIAFVAFLAGPVAARLHGGGSAPLLSAALTGAALVVWADFAAQNFFPYRYPVGIITGAIGAPILIALLIRDHRTGRRL